jgi:triphosphoribosyl-dephospho-CoA synthase
VKFGLPALRRQRAAGFSEVICRLDALFTIMSLLDDTCVLYRGGAGTLTAVKCAARAVLAAGGSSTDCGRKQIRMLDDELIAMHVSPGGSADLLAATIFLDAVERGLLEIRADRSERPDEDEHADKLEEMYGAA